MAIDKKLKWFKKVNSERLSYLNGRKLTDELSPNELSVNLGVLSEYVFSLNPNYSGSHGKIIALCINPVAFLDNCYFFITGGRTLIEDLDNTSTHNMSEYKSARLSEFAKDIFILTTIEASASERQIDRNLALKTEKAICDWLDNCALVLNEISNERAEG